jgi:hypothetical protein
MFTLSLAFALILGVLGVAGGNRDRRVVCAAVFRLDLDGGFLSPSAGVRSELPFNQNEGAVQSVRRRERPAARRGSAGVTVLA